MKSSICKSMTSNDINNMRSKFDEVNLELKAQILANATFDYTEDTHQWVKKSFSSCLQ